MWMEENVTKTHVKNAIQKFASSQKEKKDAREVIVITFMLLLHVMMIRIRLTNIFHVLVASQSLKTRCVL